MRAPSIHPGEEAVTLRPGDGKRVCSVVEGDGDASWRAGEGERSWNDRGSYFVVAESDVASGTGGGEAGERYASADEAESGAVARAYEFAFEKLASRGVAYEDRQLRRMVNERVDIFMQGGETDFPRISINDVVIEACGHPAREAETYRASVLAEYPISRLRGDINNAKWYAARVLNEAGVLVSSARSLFSDGRWLDALLELKRARDLLDTACRQPVVEGPAEQVPSLMQWAAGSLSVEAEEGIRVLDVGERREVDIPFRWSYEWEGRKVMAARLPVTFRAHGFDAVFDSDPETDDSGTAECRVVVAYGDPGEYAIEPRLDFGVLSSALGGAYAAGLEPFSGPLHRVFLVENAHALSVCLEVSGVGASDEGQLRSGFARRMERDGFRIEECGPDVDVVVSVRAEMNSRAIDDGWSTVVSVDGSAFDQRTALVIGRPSVLCEERAGTGERESEVLALKEAGRLLAAYLTHRILMSGE